MKFEDYKSYMKQKPFKKKLNEFYMGVTRYDDCIQSKDKYPGDYEYYSREAKGQSKRVIWLFNELINMYEHERQMRIMYQKMVKGRHKNVK